MSAHPSLGTKSNKLSLIVAAAAVLVITAFAEPVSAGAGAGGIGSPGSGDATSAPTRGGSKYERIWASFSARERRWANRTSACESGRNPRAIGGGGRYRGAFQFLRSTWRASPKSPGGDPIAYPYRTQGVVAVLLKRRDGPGHWPVCG